MDSHCSREEGTFALHEAIRLAQQNNKSLMLEHALVSYIKICSLTVPIFTLCVSPLGYLQDFFFLFPTSLGSSHRKCHFLWAE